MPDLSEGARLARAAQTLVCDHLCAARGETVLVGADTSTDPRVIEALSIAAESAGAQPLAALIPRLPFQGALADPYVGAHFAAAATTADVWIDATFPYLAGSGVHARAMENERTRYILLGDAGAAGLARLYAGVDLDALFDLQEAFDAFVAERTGRPCRVTSATGTDVTFTLAAPATRKLRRANRPGTQTVPGSGVVYPEIESVRGTIVLDAVFHEYFTPLRAPLTVEVDGRIRRLSGGGADAAIMDRALRRAGGGEYGHVIHFSYGFHPAARATGRSFVEDIRVLGANAVGFGLPWWVPGGGENHPDGVVATQSLAFDGEPVVEAGVLVEPALAERARALWKIGDSLLSSS